MTIGYVAQRAGVRASAIRYYEAVGLLPRVPRVGGKRRYEASILERLALIELAKSAGFELADIRTALSTPGEPSIAWKWLGDRKRVELDRQMAEVERRQHVLHRLTRCHCSTFEECGRRFEKTRIQK